MDFDSMRTLQWDLACHGGFFTEPHHDANGFCSYVQLLGGAKLWMFLQVEGDLTFEAQLAKMGDMMDFILGDGDETLSSLGIKIIYYWFEEDAIL